MPLPFIRNITKLWNSSQYYGTWYIKQNFKLNLLQWKAYLCSRKVAWISHTRTKDLKFFNSVQISDIWTLPMLWASSHNLDAYFSAWSADHPWMSLMRFSLKCAASIGVSGHRGWAEEFCSTIAVFDASLLDVWFGPGEGLLWLFEHWRLWGLTGSRPCCLSAVTGCSVADCETGPCLTTGLLAFGCDETGVLVKGLMRTLFVGGVLILGDTYNHGDDASDVKDMETDWMLGLVWRAEQLEKSEKLCWKQMVQQ